VVGYRRNFVPGGTFFFTVALEDRRSTLLTRRIDDLRSAFRQVRQEWPFDVDAIVVLPEHLHAILTLPEGDIDFPLRWRRIKTVFTRAVIAGGAALATRDGGGRVLWQRRFWEHTIRDDDDFSRHVDYIHFNPVKHGYVASPSDWPHSSLHRYVRDGVFPPDWGGVGGATESFGEPVHS
jgi:putative transposase